MSVSNMGHPAPDGNGNLPAGASQEYFEARQIVGRACIAAAGIGIPVEVVASAALGAVIEMMVERLGDERAAAQTVAGYLKAYEALAGEGLLAVDTPFTMLAEGI